MPRIRRLRPARLRFAWTGRRPGRPPARPGRSAAGQAARCVSPGPGQDPFRRPTQGRRRAQDARGHRPSSDGLEGRVPRIAGRDACREDAAQRPRRRPRPPRWLLGREGHLREPARAPRHGQPLPARRPSAIPGRARPMRTQPERQGGRALPADQHPPRQERDGRPLLRPDRPGGAGPVARRGRQAGRHREHDRAYAGRHRGAARRPERGGVSRLGRHPEPRLPREPTRDRPEPARLHRQLGRRHGGRLPDGARRPDRGRGAVVLHHVARAPLRHDRPAGRRAEPHGAGRPRHRARRLRNDARPEADPPGVRLPAPGTSSISGGRGTPSAR